MTPSEEGVADFLEMMEYGDRTDKGWHNVSPNEMTDKYGFRVLASREVTVFDYANFDNDMTFVAEAGVLEVRNATVKQFRSAVDMDVIPQEERVGIITYTENQFVLVVDQ